MLRKPVDKDKWATEPAVVNAFYNPNKNDIGKLFLYYLILRSIEIMLLRSISCWYSATTILQSKFPEVIKLWRYRCRYRTRNYPWVR